MSFSASPAWKSVIVSAPSTTAAPSSACGATPYGRPIDHPASSPNPRKPRLSSGERKSRVNARIGIAWKTSEFPG